MIPWSQPSPSLVINGQAAPSRLQSFRLTATPALAAAFGFFAFIPYPAFAIGGHTAIQFGNVLALVVAVMALTVSWKNQPFFFLPLMLAPLCLAMVRVAVVGDGDLELCFKAMLSTSIAWLALIATQYLAPRYTIALLLGIAWATILHTAVGLLQMYSFARGQFPLLFLYVNPSFLDVRDYATTIANYIQRPFGIFPEPSAMSSSLAPWALFWIAESFGLIRLRSRPTRLQRTIFAISAFCALSLIILSCSGHAAITVAAAALFTAVWLVRSRGTFSSYAAIVFVFGVVMPLIIWQLVAALSTRVTGASDVDQSWQDRAGSLSAGFLLLLNSSPSTLIFGMGPGMLAPKMASSTEYAATWSILLSFIYETGFFGILLCCGLLHYLVRTWRRAGSSMVFAVIFVVWLVGITITTSYDQLLPLWVALGWLTVWPRICALPRRRPLFMTSFQAGFRRRRPMRAGAAVSVWHDDDDIPSPIPQRIRISSRGPAH